MKAVYWSSPILFASLTDLVATLSSTCLEIIWTRFCSSSSKGFPYSSIEAINESLSLRKSFLKTCCVFMMQFRPNSILFFFQDFTNHWSACSPFQQCSWIIKDSDNSTICIYNLVVLVMGLIYSHIWKNKICLPNGKEAFFNPIPDGRGWGAGGLVGGKKAPPTSFSPVTSTNVWIRSQNFLTFSFNRFAKLV